MDQLVIAGRVGGHRARLTLSLVRGRYSNLLFNWAGGLPFAYLTKKRVPLEKSESPVKDKLSLSMPGHGNVRQRR
jgi:hypothetical protein